MVSEPIAVVGIACRMPGAADYEEYWRSLCEARESIVRASRRELGEAGVDEALRRHPRFVPAGGRFPDALAFDAQFFGYSPAEAAAIDPQQRVFLETAVHALEDAAIDPLRFDGRIGVYAGASANTYAAAFGSSDAGSLQRELGNEKDHLATRVAYKLGLTGPAVSVQTACSTSLVAMHHACSSLLAGEADVALAGGVSLRFPHDVGYIWEPEGIASSDGRCRPFDVNADGTVRGCGAGAVVLRRLEDAHAADDPIHAIVLATAVNNDGRNKVGYTAPSVGGQASVIAAAHERAGVRPAEIGYVEAHGTATSLGDPIEVAALAQAFGPWEPAEERCRIGSVKGNIGHLDAAAGIAGLIKTVLAVAHARIPPTLHFNEANPALRLDASPFAVQRTLTDWSGPRPCTAGVSSFGMGGTNAHAVVREATARALPPAIGDVPSLVLCSAPAREGTRQTLATLAEHCESTSPTAAEVAWTTQVGRTAHAERAAVVVSPGSLARDLRDPSRRTEGRIFDDPRVGLLLSGQGNSRSGLLAASCRAWPAVRTDVERCCALLGGRLGEETLTALTKAGETDADWWRNTANAQPALFVTEYVLALLLRRLGVEPMGAMGHSLGEVVAAVLAGVFSERGGIEFVAARGRLMSETDAGAMAAFGLDSKTVVDLLPPTLDLAAVNGIRQVVVSGPREELVAFYAEQEARGTPSQMLSARYGFHSSLMDDVLEPIARAAAAADPVVPAKPFVSTVTGNWIDAEAADPAHWACQARRPVLFAAALTNLHANANILVEVGPGVALAHLALAATDPSCICVPMLGDGSDDAEAVLATTGALWAGGVSIDWTELTASGARRRIRLPGHRFERVLHRPRRSAGPSKPSHSLYEPLWRELPPLRAEMSPGAELGVIGAPDALREATVATLRAGGCRVDVLDGVDVPVASSAWPKRTVFVMPDADSEDAHLRAFGDLLDLVRATSADGGRERSITVVARNGSGVDENDGPRPAAALARGIALVLPQEEPSVACRLIDFASGEGGDMSALARELLAAGPSEVSLRASRRWERRLAVVEDPESDGPGLARGGRYVVLGADGRIGGTLVTHLRTCWNAQVASVTRRDPGDGRDPLRIASDLGCPGAVADVLGRAHAALGGIDTVFHCAAVTRGPSLREIRVLDRMSAAEQWPTKVLATRELAECASDLDIPLCVVFSSIASVLGGLELSAYAAASAYQDAIAVRAARDRPGAWQTIGWDAWAFPGDETIAGYGEHVRAAALTPEEGMRALERALRHAHSHPYLVVGHDVPARAWEATADLRERPSASTGPATAGPSTNSNDPSDAVLDVLAAVLGYEAIDGSARFPDLGGDSLLAVQLIGELRERFGVDVRLRAVFEAEDIDAFCAHVRDLDTSRST